MEMIIFWALFFLSIILLLIGIIIGYDLCIRKGEYNVIAYIKFDTKSIESKLEGNFGAFILWVGLIILIITLMVYVIS
ncbi:MAG: hypothetical protein ACFFDN_47905 [Candidatus Hodarchaeota archaeon]